MQEKNILALEFSCQESQICTAKIDQKSFQITQTENFTYSRHDTESEVYQKLEALKNVEKNLTILIGIGPGSYNAIRMAIAIAIAYNFSKNNVNKNNIITIPSLLTINTEEKNYHFITIARRNSFSYTEITDNKNITKPILLEQKDIQKKLKNKKNIFTFDNNINEKIKLTQKLQTTKPTAQKLVKYFTQNQNFKSFPLEPLYLAPPFITTPKKSKIIQ